MKMFKTIKLNIDYSENLEDLIKRGKYDWVDSNINSSNFPNDRKDKEKIELKLIHFGEGITTKEVLKELEAKNLRPANLYELLNLGIKESELQRKFYIVTLGSVWRDPDGSRYCAYLGRHSDGRHLHLDWFDYRWYDYCRFAAVRK